MAKDSKLNPNIQPSFEMMVSESVTRALKARPQEQPDGTRVEEATGPEITIRESITLGLPFPADDGEDSILSAGEDVGDGSLCPSAHPNMPGGVVFGVILGTPEDARVSYLREHRPATDDTLSLSDPATPTEVFRIATPCAKASCIHFSGSECRLAGRVRQGLPEVTDDLPRCGLRPRCLWWRQEGKAACYRCPQVVTNVDFASEKMRSTATSIDPSAAVRWEEL